MFGLPPIVTIIGKCRSEFEWKNLGQMCDFRKTSNARLNDHVHNLLFHWFRTLTPKEKQKNGRSPL